MTGVRPLLGIERPEDLDGAVEAIALLRAQPEVDRKRIYVIGHSQGGEQAPRIARADPDLGGLVILAGNTRPVEDLVLEQLRTVRASAPQVAAAEAAARRIRDPALRPDDTVDLLGATLPGSYFLDLRGYRPAEVAASLRAPMLVLHGERDYQVTAADFQGWRRALGRNPRARLRLLPGLNHLFVRGTGPSLPEEYLRPGHVDEVVIDEVVQFITSSRPAK